MSPSHLLEPGEIITYQAELRLAAYIGACVMLLSLMMSGPLSSLLTTQLLLTNKRLIGRRGLFWKKTITVPHKQIEMVRVQQGLFGTCFGYGTVIISTTSGNRVAFKGIAYPLEVQQVVEEAVEMAVLGRKLSQTVLSMPLPTA